MHSGDDVALPSVLLHTMGHTITIIITSQKSHAYAAPARCKKHTATIRRDRARKARSELSKRAESTEIVKKKRAPICKNVSVLTTFHYL